ncbi:hypothetical protein AAG906_027937 [Vitis piasezkii]
MGFERGRSSKSSQRKAYQLFARKVMEDFDYDDSGEQWGKEHMVMSVNRDGCTCEWAVGAACDHVSLYS